jgi:hypothetical protein
MVLPGSHEIWSSRQDDRAVRFLAFDKKADKKDGTSAMIRDTRSPLAKLLVAYYGLLELAHLGVLAWAGLRFLRSGNLGFPAAPPPGGWSEQVVPFMIATAVLDAFNVLLAWAFVYGYWTRACWRWWLGGVTLAATLYSAIVFVAGTVASGAWQHRPAGYLSMVVVALPVIALAILYGLWGVTGQFDQE